MRIEQVATAVGSLALLNVLRASCPMSLSTRAGRCAAVGSAFSFQCSPTLARAFAGGAERRPKFNALQRSLIEQRPGAVLPICQTNVACPTRVCFTSFARVLE